VLLGLPFAFAQHSDACAVHQQMQAGCGWHSLDDDLQCLLSPNDRAVAGNGPFKPSQPQKALRHAHGLMLWQIEEALDAQAELDGLIGEHLPAA
jgi:hypothetical protein